MLLPRLTAWLCAALATAVVQSQESRGDIKSIPLRTHSLNQPYLDSDMQSRWFDFGGDTVVRADKYIRLTTDRPSQMGWIFSRVPLTATNWEIEVEFKITGPSNLFGDGMAIWLTKQRAIPGPVFGSTDKFEGLGIFIDTYKNNRPGTVFPYVMAMVGDGNTEYDQGHDGKANEVAGCSARGIRNAQHPTKARLTYFQDQNLVLELMYKSDEEWTPCFDIPNIKIPSVAYLGFSAETGELSEKHDIITVDTKNLYSTASTAAQRSKEEFSRQKGSTRNRKTPSSSWSWFLLKWILILVAVAVVGYIGFTVWRSQQRGSRF